MEGFAALYIFMLAAFTGYEVIARVPVILHTPLMSGSNFVHGVVLVGAMVAELLDLPHVASVVELKVGEGKLEAHREIEGGAEVVEAPLPCVVTAQKGLNEPRYPSLKGIMAAKKKDVRKVAAPELILMITPR